MLKGAMAGILLRGLIAILLAGAMSNLASAQGRRDGEPGQFDFYVLSLSWSPSFCAAAAERGADARRRAMRRPAVFVRRARAMAAIRARLSGILPGAGAAARSQTSSMPMLDLMPAPRLDLSTSGTSTAPVRGFRRAPISTIRKARAAVKIPADYVDLQKPLSVSPDAVEDAFIKANPGLRQRRRRGIVRPTTPDRSRVCLSKDLKVSRLPRGRSSAVAATTIIVMPPVRGGPG